MSIIILPIIPYMRSYFVLELYDYDILYCITEYFMYLFIQLIDYARLIYARYTFLKWLVDFVLLMVSCSLAPGYTTFVLFSISMRWILSGWFQKPNWMLQDWVSQGQCWRSSWHLVWRILRTIHETLPSADTRIPSCPWRDAPFPAALQ